MPANDMLCNHSKPFHLVFTLAGNSVAIIERALRKHIETVTFYNRLCQCYRQFWYFHLSESEMLKFA